VNARTLLAAGVVGLALGAVVRAKHTWSFSGKVVLITGGSRGLGLVLARQLAAQGARLALLARGADDLTRAARELRGRGAEVLELPTDVGDEAQVGAAVAATAAHYGRLDVLINNAGIIQVGPAEQMTLDDYDAAMKTHFWGPLYAMRAAWPHMQRQGGGRIVNIASIGGKVALPHLAPYSASKFALVGLSDALRAEGAQARIRITTVCPWLVRTGSYRNVEVKGQRERELAWFAVADSLPLLSARDVDTARKILDACRRAAPRLILEPYGKAAALADTLLPNLSAAALAWVSTLLPDPVAGGEVARKGFESFSSAVPSPLTRLSDDAAARNNQLGVQARARRL
jgi:NAD(P)-dependent dehydrogenase (short-subunit alcohol dehydrogenase family)